MSKKTDIDIDIANRDELLKVIPHTPASMIHNNIIKKHNVGVYVDTNVPHTGLASIDYKWRRYGYFKLDVLNNSIYESIKSEHVIAYLMLTILV